LRFFERFGSTKPIIGVIHLPALPGYPETPGLDAVIEKALRDLAALEDGGAHGVLVENEYDRPHRVLSAPETTAAMTRVTREVVAAARGIVVGAEILLNDPKASLAVSLAAGGSFMRTDYFVDPMARPEHGGRMHIDPDGLLAYRRAIGADNIMILADIQVKYATMLVERSLAQSAALAGEKGADAIVVSGDATGQPPSAAAVGEAKSGAGPVPVILGSGLDADNAAELLAVADGAIVGTSLKVGEIIAAERVCELVAIARALERAA
jgi:membrane complex biogenesis BtpA family protein